MRVRQRLEYLDGIRGLSALYVTASHAYQTYSVHFLSQTNGGCADAFLHAMHWLNYGRSAVAVFIVLSGYCLMLPVVQSEDGRLAGGTLRFYLRRARRLLPPYYGALIVSLVLISTVPGMGESDTGDWHKAFWSQVFPAFTPGVIVSHLLLVHNYHPSWQHAIDYPMWSLATEWQILFLFPLFVTLWNRESIGHVVMAAMRITLGLQVVLMVLMSNVNPWPPQFVTLFALGMGAATVNFPRRGDLTPARPRPWGWLAASLFGSYLVLEVTVGRWLLETGHQQAPDLVVGGGTACLLVYCTQAIKAGSRPWILQRFESGLLIGVGRFSYSLYLIHAPVLALVFLILQGSGVPTLGIQSLMLSLGIALSLIASYGFYQVCERPFSKTRIVGAVSHDGRGPAGNTGV